MPVEAAAFLSNVPLLSTVLLKQRKATSVSVLVRHEGRILEPCPEASACDKRNGCFVLHGVNVVMVISSLSSRRLIHSSNGSHLSCVLTLFLPSFVFDTCGSVLKRFHVSCVSSSPDNG